MTTPAAWVDTCRDMPSRETEYWNSSFQRGPWSRNACRSPSSSMALASGGAPGPAGIFLEILLISFKGRSRTRPTSRTTVREAMVPKVTIWVTHSRPYLSRVYSMTRSRPSLQKSMSMSGIDTRLEFRKRSKSRSYLRGQSRVMSSR